MRSMDILTLELLDVTVFQALLELREILAEHPGERLRIQGEDETLCLNVAAYLERQGRPARQVRQGDQWELQVPAAPRPMATRATAAIPPPVARRPILLLRAAYAPGDRALGRRLLLETLGQVPEGTPWVCLAHQALELLEDPLALEVFRSLQSRAIAVRVSRSSLAHAGLEAGALEVVEDLTWERLLAQGEVTVL